MLLVVVRGEGFAPEIADEFWVLRAPKPDFSLEEPTLWFKVRVGITILSGFL